ncbi:MAG: TonB-dependent receptor [Salinivirgaceae bacterium]|jgi:TonB-linked SusC/RagA family outer membrane protein|nr:TonB-dependent receptor [Salinivirgaceae bacterium]
MKKLILNLLFFVLPFLTMAQAMNINGKVIDQNDQVPIPGVTVVLKGTTTGTITDIDGNYSISFEKMENAILIFSFIGYETQEVAVNGQATLDVNMVTDIADLDEVVVVGYGTIKKKLITGANLNVKGEQIAELTPVNAMDALKGITPGLSITQDNGQPGSGTKVNIRGMGTIGDSEPLYIVDGVTVGDIDYLNPSDIESIDVLKDAASAAIYGSRAANGVVLVTTKKGKKGQPIKVSYNSYYGIQNISRKLDMLNAQQYMEIMDEGNMNLKGKTYDWEAKLPASTWNMLQNGWEGTNWLDEVAMKNAPIKNHSINVTGAEESVVYSFGASYIDQAGIIGGDIIDAGYKRATFRLNTEYVLAKNNDSDIIKVGQNLTYMSSRNKRVADGSIYWNDLRHAIRSTPLQPVYDEEFGDKYNYSPPYDQIAIYMTNPIATMWYDRNFASEPQEKVIGNVYTEIQPIRNLKLRSTYGIDWWSSYRRTYSEIYNLGDGMKRDEDAVEMGMTKGKNWQWTNTASYNFSVGDHNIAAVAGHEMWAKQLDFQVYGNASNSIFEYPDYGYLDLMKDPEDVTKLSTWGSDYAAGGGALLSYFGRVSYDYQERYLFSAVLRADGSSNFDKGNRWGVFPSFAAGWVFTREAFLANITDIVDFGKLRFSWGQNGNQSIQNFEYSSSISYGGRYYFGTDKITSAVASYPARVPNPNVQWETSEQINLGLDVNMFNSRLQTAFDIYKKTTKDWLVIPPILATAGASAANVNGGEIENSGLEIALGWRDQVANFKYGATVTFDYRKNLVTEVNNEDGIIHGNTDVLDQGKPEIQRVEVGYPIGYFWALETDGIIQNDAELAAYEEYLTDADGLVQWPNIQPGDFRYVDQNGDGRIDSEDKKMIGDPNPDYIFGLQLNMEYKGAYIAATFNGQAGAQVMQSYRQNTEQTWANYTTDVYDRWHGEGTSNTYPILSSSAARNYTLMSDFYMHDADFLRFSNLTIGYRFGKFLKNVNFISDINLYVTGKNLYVFTKYNGMDPEIGYNPNDDDDEPISWQRGIDLGLYPSSRTYLMGINVTF